MFQLLLGPLERSATAINLTFVVAGEVAEIRAKTGLTKQQVRRWTHTARTRNYIKRIEETGKQSLCIRERRLFQAQARGTKLRRRKFFY